MKKLVLFLIVFLSFSALFAQDFWKIYNSRNTPDLYNTQELMVLNDDTAFICSSNGLLLYENGLIRVFQSNHQDFYNSQMLSLHLSQGKFWIDFSDKFGLWNGIDFDLFTKPSNSYSMVAVDSYNRPWFQNNGVVYIFENNSFTLHTEFEALRIIGLKNGNVIGFHLANYTGSIANFGYLYKNGQTIPLTIDTNIFPEPKYFNWITTTLEGNVYLYLFNSALKIDKSGVSTGLFNNPVFSQKNRSLIPQEELGQNKFYIPNTNNNHYYGVNILRVTGSDSTLFSNVISESDNIVVKNGIQCSASKIWVLTNNVLAVADQSLSAKSVSEVLDVNSIKATFSARNVFFNSYCDINADTLNFQILGGQLANCFYTSKLWIGGVDENDSIHVSKNYFGDEDFAPGRITNVSGVIENPIFKLSKAEIDLHKLLFDKPGYRTPESIKKWPANGNPLLGQFSDGAPFYDLNDNGIYEPALGDYPFILGDQAVCWFSNDQSDLAYNRTCNTLGLEIFSMAYGFIAPNNKELNQTIFLRNVIINRSGMDYDSVKLAVLNDFDIGYMFDDYIGCDSLNSIGYAYNGDAYDEDFANENGFLDKIPCVGMKFISHPLHSATIFGFGSLNIPSYNASTTWCYNRLNNIYSNNFQIPTWQYAGDPLTNVGQTENNVGNTPNDRSNFMITNIDHFAADERITFDVVVGYGFAPDQSSNYLEAIPEMKAVLNGAATYFENMIIDYNHLNLGNGEVFKSIENDEISVYPNPTLGMLIIDANRPIDRLEIYSISGEIIKTISMHQSGVIEVDLSNLNGGLYILKMYDFEGSQHVKKIVKQ